MKLTPGQVRLVAPFWPTISGRRLRFTGGGGTIQLQETALVIEGNLLRFFYLGIERFFGGVFGEWTTVTVPYSRITSVRYRSRVVVRVVLLVPVVVLVLLMAVGIVTGGIGVLELAAALVALAIPVGVLVFVAWWMLGPLYTVKFRAKDGTRTVFCFRIRSRKRRREFDAALEKYRDAAQRYDTEGRSC